MKRSPLRRTQKPLKRTRLKPISPDNHYEDWKQTVALPALRSLFNGCWECRAVDVPLDVDHILNRSTHPQLIMELANVQLLCRPCHSAKTLNHRYG